MAAADIEIGALTTIERAVLAETRIGHGNELDNLGGPVATIGCGGVLLARSESRARAVSATA